MPYDGTGWDETIPASSEAILDGDDHIKDVKKAFRIRMEKEHVALGASSAGGEHKKGQCAVLYAGTTVALAALGNLLGAVGYDTTLKAFCYNSGAAWVPIAYLEPRTWW